ncbi:MAG: flagellar biosynthetic protein FliO [Phycisphaeraceae bacterium]
MTQTRKIWCSVLCGLMLGIGPAVALGQAASNDGKSASDDALTSLARQLATAKGEPAPVAMPAANVSPSAATSADSSVASSAAPAFESPPIAPNDRLPLSPARRGGDVSAAPAGAATSGWLGNTLAALAAVIGLIVIARGALAKWSGRSSAVTISPVAEVLTRITIAPRNHILLVRLGNRILVLGDSPAGLRTLESIADPEEIADLLTLVAAGKPNSISHGFSQLLGRFSGEHHTGRPEDDLAEPGGDEQEFHVDRARDRVSGLLARFRTGGSSATRPDGGDA